MRLKDYPIRFDSTELFKPEKWEESYEVLENVNETEAGTDSIEITRDEKLTISAEFACTSEWVRRFRMFAKQNTINVQMYDSETNGYKTYMMRIRNFKKGTEPHSEYVRSSVGLYNVTFDLIQF